MASDNRLQITAELIDRVSPAARKMQRAFDDLQRSTGKQLPEAFRKYAQAVTNNEKALQNYGRRSEVVRREIRAFQEIVLRTAPTVGRLTESLGAFSTGSGAAVGAIGAMGAALLVAGKQAADFATQMKQIKFGSEASGLGILQLKQTQQALAEIGISSEQTSAAMANLKSRMVDAQANTGKFIDSFSDPSFREYAMDIVHMATEGASTADVLLKVLDQTDAIKKRLGGSRGVNVAGRYLEELGLPKELARGSSKEVRERLEFARLHGSTGAEMKEAAEQAKLFNEKLFAGGVVLDRMALVFKKDITKGFLYVNDLLDRIDAKFNAFFGTGGTSPTAPGGGTFADLARPGSGPQGAGPRVYGGSHGGGAGAAPGGGGPTFRRGVGPGARTTTGGDPRGLEGYIREQAALNHVDPNVAMAVARSEGLANPVGDAGKSHGAFQLYTGGGLGNEFQKQTGLDPSDPKNERATIAWALAYAGRTKSWGPWHGAPKAGVGLHQGFDYTGAPGAVAPGAETAVGGGAPAAFIMHHTGGRGTVAGVQSTLRQRGLGVEYVMDRDGNIIHTGGPGSAHMLPGWGAGAGLSNKNVVGMEVIAKSNRDVTAAQIAAAQAFIAQNYPNTPVYGHGEVNPGHKEADEGMAIVNAIRAGRLPSSAQSRVDFNAGLSGPPASVNGTGKIDVNVSGAAVGKTARSQGLFKNLNLQRQQQMQPASAGPAQGASPL